MIKSHWENDVDVTVYFDGSKKSIGVGESTTPLIQYLVSLLEENPYDFIRNSKCTFKLGIDFKVECRKKIFSWICNKKQS